MKTNSPRIHEAFRRLLADKEEIRAVSFVSRVERTWERLLGLLPYVELIPALIPNWNSYVAVTNQRVLFLRLTRWGKPNYHKTYSVPISDVSSDGMGLSVRSANRGIPEYLRFVSGVGDLDFIQALNQGTEAEPKLDPTNEKICPRCAERIKRDALVCIHCGQEFNQADIQAAIQQAEEQKQAARLVAQTKASQAQAEAELLRRRNRSRSLAILGGLLTLVSSCGTVILLFYSFSEEAAEAAKTSGVMAAIVPFVCVIPVLAIGVWLLFLGIKRLRSLPKTENKLTN
jgi:hypothetical protein